MTSASSILLVRLGFNNSSLFLSLLPNINSAGVLPVVLCAVFLYENRKSASL
ncbi:unnamed protein product, partial [Nesidiocoris tenuis]